MPDFKDLGLSDNLLQALEAKGFTDPTPIQIRTIPLLLEGDADVVGQAQTGTGKTAAFGLPIIERIKEKAGHVQALVLAPTRELALQVADEIMSLRGQKWMKVVPVYGGQSIGLQFRALKTGADVVVGTPGRVLDHLSRGTLDLSNLSFFVLDEADEMCNMGFVEDVRAIFEHVGEGRRTLLFSATMSRDVTRIAEEFMGDYEVVKVAPRKADQPLVDHSFHEVADSDRFEALCRVIDANPDFYGMVFCRTRADTREVAERLMDRCYPAEAIHGDLSQAVREDILNKFRKKRVNVLVATDVAARGIDVPDLTHVINLALPQDPDTFVHRTGRTGRAGKAGIAVTLISPREFRKLMYITQRAGIKIEKQKLPNVKDVIFSKKARISSSTVSIIEDGEHSAYMDMAVELLEDRDPVEVVAASLRQAFGDELDVSTYKEINEAFQKKPHRVFIKIAAGRKDGLTPPKLVNFICREAGMKPFQIQNVKVFKTDSKFSVPGHLEDKVLKAINRGAGKRPLATRAK